MVSVYRIVLCLGCCAVAVAAVGGTKEAEESASSIIDTTTRKSHPCFIPKYDRTTTSTVITSPEPWTYAKAADFPEEFDWRNVNGTNWLTKDLNQHIPKYCGSCWAHGPISSMGDRIKILRKAAWPEINLSVQDILNCGKDAGSCHGGDDLGAWKYLYADGVADDTCQGYLADDFECNAEDRCRDCLGFTGQCWGVKKYKVYKIEQYGYCNGRDKMKAELFHRGPISCGVDATHLFNYTGGIIKEKGQEIDHIVSVVGWGKDKDTGVSYWNVRNSWGTYHGEEGYFRAAMSTGAHDGALLIEEDCTWGVPEWPPKYNTDYEEEEKQKTTILNKVKKTKKSLK